MYGKQHIKRTASRIIPIKQQNQPACCGTSEKHPSAITLYRACSRQEGHARLLPYNVVDVNIFE